MAYKIGYGEAQRIQVEETPPGVHQVGLPPMRKNPSPRRIPPPGPPCAALLEAVLGDPLLGSPPHQQDTLPLFLRLKASRLPDPARRAREGQAAARPQGLPRGVRGSERRRRLQAGLGAGDLLQPSTVRGAAEGRGRGPSPTAPFQCQSLNRYSFL
ncbi:hypothetical protein SAY86_004115 [Trapa natans]|uniref:Uncharacterized protein n=1 Tax=Trapa natans TaxID=22666 RepID=A0AAN7M787_TRANT|nr:hypothetical protein SAY86_004115 [Trapa natans]